jgi:hypothetical protein
MLAVSIIRVLEMAEESIFETSVNHYQNARRKSPEDIHPHTRDHENLKSYLFS